MTVQRKFEQCTIAYDSRSRHESVLIRRMAIPPTEYQSIHVHRPSEPRISSLVGRSAHRLPDAAGGDCGPSSWTVWLPCPKAFCSRCGARRVAARCPHQHVSLVIIIRLRSCRSALRQPEHPGTGSCKSQDTPQPFVPLGVRGSVPDIERH